MTIPRLDAASTAAATERVMPRVSVVMPVHNGERYLAAAVASVLASTLRELELLLLDDASTDRTAEIGAAAAAADHRVRVISLPRGGVTAARNRGLAEARADYIANLDADDLMLPSRLALQAAFLDANPNVAAVGSRVLIIDESGRPTGVRIRAFTHAEIDASHLAGQAGAIANPAAMFRRSAAQRAGGYREKFATSSEDYDLWLRLAETGTLRNLTAILTLYRIHGSNMSVGEEKRAERHRNRLAALADAFERRGIADRKPQALPAPPLALWERQRDIGLLHLFRGRRLRGLVHGAIAVVLRPGDPSARDALTEILSGPPTRPA